jgi:hypothetical protein
MDDKPVPTETPPAQTPETQEPTQQQPAVSAKKKVKTKPDKYHAALKGKMASVGVYRRVHWKTNSLRYRWSKGQGKGCGTSS